MLRTYDKLIKDSLLGHRPFSAAVEALVEALPTPPWWRPWARYRFAARKDWVKVCALFGWPMYYKKALDLGVDRDSLDAVILFLGEPHPKMTKPHPTAEIPEWL